MMNSRTTSMLLGSLLLLGSGTLLAGDDGWTDDFEAAKAKAQAEGKDLFMDFTGSDWCGWCIKLHKEVFDEDLFKEAIHQNFILVKLDYPRDQSLVTEEVKAQNEVLQQKYGIQGYPTIFLTDATGRPYAKTGYQKGGAEPYLAHLNEFVEARKVRDGLFAKAEQADGLAKAKLLDQALSSTAVELLFPFYVDTVSEVIALDPDNEAELKEKYSAMIEADEIKTVCMGLEKDFQSCARAGDWAGVVKMMTEAAEVNDHTGPVAHHAYFFMAIAHLQGHEFSNASESLDKAVKADPQGRFIEYMPKIREEIANLGAAGGGEKQGHDDDDGHEHGDDDGSEHKEGKGGK